MKIVSKKYLKNNYTLSSMSDDMTEKYLEAFYSEVNNELIKASLNKEKVLTLVFTDYETSINSKSVPLTKLQFENFIKDYQGSYNVDVSPNKDNTDNVKVVSIYGWVD